MIWLIAAPLLCLGIFILTVLSVKLRSSPRSNTPDAYSNDDFDPRFFGNLCAVAAGALLIILMVFTVIRSFHQVDQNSVGIVYQFGSIVGQTNHGFVSTAPWQDLETESTKVQRWTNSKDVNKDAKPLVAFSKETQDVFVVATFTYSVSPDRVQSLWSQAGQEWFQNLGIEARIATFLKEETVKYSAADIAPAREQIRQAVRDRLTEDLSRYSITVNDFLLDNIDYSDQFKQAIENKQAAVQNAQAEQNKVQVAKAQADQLIATANGQAEATRITAQGQADANETLSRSLTPALIQYQAIQKLADKIQIALIPSGQGIIIDPATILGSSR